MNRAKSSWIGLELEYNGNRVWNGFQIIKISLTGPFSSVDDAIVIIAEDKRVFDEVTVIEMLLRLLLVLRLLLIIVKMMMNGC